jgi:putative membrane protein
MMETAIRQLVIAAIFPLVLIVGGGVLAQDVVPPKTDNTRAPSDNADPQQFATEARIGNLFEVESSAVAKNKTKSPDIAAFAQMMIEDHGKADAELETAAKEQQASSLPEELDADEKAKLEQLMAASETDFDSLYVKLQTEAHAEAVALFSKYSQNGPSGALKDFAAKTLPKLKTHEAMVLQLAD